MSKMNLKNLTMAFATAAAVPAPAADADTEATRVMVTKKIAEIKQKKTAKAEPETEAVVEPKAKTKAAKEPKEIKVKAAAKVKTPKAKEPKVKAPKLTQVFNEDGEKLFTIAGTSKVNGVTKMRFGNDLVSRTKWLADRDNTDIQFFDLPKAMTKAEVVEFFKANPEYGIDEDALSMKDEFLTTRRGGKKSALTTPAE